MNINYARNKIMTEVAGEAENRRVQFVQLYNYTDRDVKDLVTISGGIGQVWVDAVQIMYR